MANVLGRSTTAASQRRRPRRRGVRRKHLSLLACAIGCIGAAAAVHNHHLRRRGDRRLTDGEQEKRRATESSLATSITDGFECPPSHNGYFPTPGCRKYYWCENGARTSPIIYGCTDGLLFDENVGVCNWETEVYCGLLPQPTNVPTAPVPTISPTTPSPTKFDFQKRTDLHGKEIIGYLHGDTYPRIVSPDQINYTKLTRINYATYKTNEGGLIYMKGGHNNINSEADVTMLFGPRIWNAKAYLHARTFCHSNPTGVSNNSICTTHDYTRGMIHLAHVAGVEVYPSISLDVSASLSKLNKQAFIKNAMRLLDEFGFDGIDINLELPKEGDSKSGSVALISLLGELRYEIVKLMYKHGRYFGLTVVVPCQPDLIGQYEIEALEKLVDEFNVYTLDLNTAKSSTETVPQAPLFLDHAHREKYISLHSCVTSWLVGGATQDKLNVGLSFYGQTYKGATAMYAKHGGFDDSHWINADSDRDGRVPYHSIYPRLRTDSLTTMREDTTKTEFAKFDENNGLGTGLVSYENEWTLCEKAGYLNLNKLNGHFVWELGGDVLDGGRATPLLDLVNLKLKDPYLDCEQYASAPAKKVSENKSKIQQSQASVWQNNPANKEEKTANKETDTVKYGPPKYFPSFVDKSCSDNQSLKPSWVTNGHLYRSKKQCCQELFGSSELDICLGEGFVETNIIQQPTRRPTRRPTKKGASNTRKPSSKPNQKNNSAPSTSRFDSQQATGLCATSKSEVARVFRTARVCSNDNPCPKGLACFRDIDLGSTAAEWKKPTSRPTQQPTQQPTVTPKVAISAEHDVTLSEEDPNKQYGTHPLLVLDGKQGSQYDAVLKFDITFLDSKTIETKSAVLRLYVKDGAGYCGTFTAMKNNWWDDTATWANDSLRNNILDVPIGQAYDVKPREFYEIDVARSIKWALLNDHQLGKKYLGIRISSTFDNRCIFSSSNGTPSYAPYLWVEMAEKELPPLPLPLTVSDSSKAVAKPSPRPSSTSKFEQPDPPAKGETLILRAIDDTTVIKERPSLILGHETDLTVRDDDVFTSDVLIRFDIQQLRRTIPTNAVLGLHVKEACESAGIFMTTSRRDGGNWNENEVSWSNAPSYRTQSGGGTMIGKFGRVKGSKWAGFDILPAFTRDMLSKQTILTIRISSDNGSTCKYSSIQDGKAAKLMLKF